MDGQSNLKKAKLKQKNTLIKKFLLSFYIGSITLLFFIFFAIMRNTFYTKERVVDSFEYEAVQDYVESSENLSEYEVTEGNTNSPEGVEEDEKEPFYSFTDGFFDFDGKLYFRKKAGEEALLFDKADPYSDKFKIINRPSYDVDIAFDDVYVYFPEFDEIQKNYRANSIPISEEEYWALNNDYEQSRTKGISNEYEEQSDNEEIPIIWLEAKAIDSKVLTFKRISKTLEKTLGSNILSIRTPLGELAHIETLGLNSEARIHSDGSSLLFFTELGVYQAKPNEPAKRILDVKPEKMTYRSGNNIIYYKDSSRELAIYSYNTETGEHKEVYISDDSTIKSTGYLNISPDEKFLLTSIKRTGFSYDEFEIILIDIEKSKISTVAKGDIYALAISPDNSKVFVEYSCMYCPEDNKLYYISKNSSGVWDKKPILVKNTGSIFIHSNDLGTVSPKGNYISFVSQTKPFVTSCVLEGWASSLNSVKILNLNDLSVKIIQQGKPEEDYRINGWVSDESGFYFTKDTLNLVEEYEGTKVLDSHGISKCASGVLKEGDVEFLKISK